MTVQQTARRKPGFASRALGRRVRALRQARQWSLEKLAERAGIHSTYLSSLERGYRNPTLNLLVALANALSVPLPKLMDGIESGGDKNERARN